MCGIVGYLGFRRADGVIISALKRLEYRGYDSWGVAVRDDNEIRVIKKVGAIGDAGSYSIAGGNLGVGHTRWATHGKPSEINAHPHTDCSGKIAVVHNGIISNFQSLKEELESRGHIFKSETDTEVIAHLIEESYQGDLKEAVGKAVERLRGSYAIVALHAEKDELVAVRYKSPLVLGAGDEEWIIASDVPAILDYTNRVVYLEDGDMVVLSRDGFEVWNNGARIERMIETIPWSIEDAEKGGYEHFMLKEIHEIPKVIEDTLFEYLSEDIEIDASFSAGISEIVFIACGTSYHASLVGRYLIEKLTGIPVRVEFASEFIYHQPPMHRALAIAITQSGETADTLEAMRIAKRLGARTLAVVNVLGSTATRIADHVLYTRAGPEISVAATKSFIAQLVVLYLIALKLSRLPGSEVNRLIDELRAMPELVRKVLELEDEIEQIASLISGYENVMYVGRGIGVPIAMEGALKMKEISYIHAEAYPAGELKHGPFALLGERTPVIASLIPDETYEIMLNNIKEVKARESVVVAVADEDDREVEKYVDFVIRVPKTEHVFAAITHSVALQLLAYHTARKRGCEIDKPRNLAKSVTVE
ncbi:glutamine--fructose-6-phosphate transaminase (isomerizing) [Geoglobus acetivorans]|uniref:Glutamine--fructose-6-phosphate aminotransferase [isomerizing] n=1 Tax=Geoglobus acetivorans TaxID=565033 RepID=A0A0A7GGT2_GEOAI|nr:glucosamine--fructose-6-phosphate aminotransferase,isomerizing [Geoglobus acetivorans]